MPANAHVQVEIRGPVGTAILTRPERHNALDERTIDELTAALLALSGNPTVRAIQLAGRGASFCAGGDVAWIRRAGELGPEEGLADARRLATLCTTLDRCAKPTVARVQGPAWGGGVGLVAACDVAIAVEGATFALSEVRLGIVPAVIGPFVVAAIGERAARRYFLTGERFSASEARRLGLVSEVVPDEAALDAKVAEVVEALAAGGPVALREAKLLLRSLRGRPPDDSPVEELAATFARLRASPEGREGAAAFLEKRRPRWRDG